MTAKKKSSGSRGVAAARVNGRELPLRNHAERALQRLLHEPQRPPARAPVRPGAARGRGAAVPRRARLRRRQPEPRRRASSASTAARCARSCAVRPAGLNAAADGAPGRIACRTGPPRTAVGFRQDRPRRARARRWPRAASSCSPPAAPRRRCAEAGVAVTRGRRATPASPRSWTGASRRCIRRSTAACSAARGTDDAVMARARHRADRPGRGEPLSVRGHGRAAGLHATTRRSRTSTSAARRCCARRRRTTSDVGGASSTRPTTPRCSTSSTRPAARSRRRRASRSRRKAFAHTAALRRRDRRLPRRARRRRGAAERRFPRTLPLVVRASCRTCATARTRTSRRRSTATAAAPRRASPTRAHAAGQGAVATTTSPTPTPRCECVRQFDEPACVIVKHANPCGVARRRRRSREAYERAYRDRSDLGLRRHHRLQPRARRAPPRSAIAERQFVEVLIAPGYRRRRAARCSRPSRTCACCELGASAGGRRRDARAAQRVGGGLLVQTRDTATIAAADAARSSRSAQPTDARARRPAVRLARRASSSSRTPSCSRATARTLGVGAGQMSRVDSARIAAHQGRRRRARARAARSMASDAFFPFRDGLDVAAEAGITRRHPAGRLDARRRGDRRRRRARHGDGVHRHAPLPALSHEGPGRRRRRPRARAGLEAARSRRASPKCSSRPATPAPPPSRGCATSTSPPTTSPALVALARRENVDLTDRRARRRRWSRASSIAFSAAGLRCFGPTRAAAQLEGSKAFAKEFLRAPRHPDRGATRRSPTRRRSTRAYVQRAAARRSSSRPTASPPARAWSSPRRVEEAHRGARRRCSAGSFGDAGARVVDRGIPRRRGGELHRHGRRRARRCRSRPRRITSACATATTGPNTGGMGAYSPAPVVTPAVHARIMREVIEPTHRGLARRRHAVHRLPLCRPDDRRRRHAATCSSSTAASAIRRRSRS